MTALVLLPIALGVFAAGGAIMWPVARTIERRANLAETAPAPRQRHEATAAPDIGYVGRHRWETASGCTTQKRLVAALREPTAEFQAIVAANYRSGELTLIGRPPHSDRRSDLPPRPVRANDAQREEVTRR